MASLKPPFLNKSEDLLHKALHEAVAPFFCKDRPLRLAVAFSGGMDSAVLLHVAATVFPSSLLALHVDHGINEASSSWERFCARTAALYGAEFFSMRLEGLRSGMPNLEEQARNGRWTALLQMARQHQASVLVTAHHANDQAETVLLNLLRGTGLAGIGMTISSQREGFPILRPWLNFAREELAAYAQQHALQWVEDPSNGDLKLRRNAVRHQLWPAVLETDARALPALSRFAQLAAETETLLQMFGMRELASMLPQGNRLDWLLFEDQLPAAQALLFRLWLKTLELRPPTQARLAAMLQQLRGKGAYGVRCHHAGCSFFKWREGPKIWVEARVTKKYLS